MIEEIANSIDGVLWEADLNSGYFNYVSPKVSEILGYSEEECLRFKEIWSNCIHPDDKTNALEAYKKAALDQPNQLIEYRFLRKSGHYIWVQDRLSVVKNKDSIVLRGILFNVNESRNNEHFDYDLRAELENKLKELDALNQELEQFAYVASHDLQEPLRMITSFLMQLSRKYEDDLDEKAHMYINFAVDGAQRMNQIILDLLEFSRAGQIEPDSDEYVNLNDVVNDLKVLLNATISEKNARITSVDLPNIGCPYTPMRQVFQNIISNALKYSKRDIQPIIDIKYKREQEFHMISIQDNGIGIDEKYHQRIFEIFQRLHTRDEYPGSGIGLALSRKIMQKLGGEIFVESEICKGSIFILKLPAEEIRI